MNILRFFRPGEQAPTVAELDNSVDAPPSKVYGQYIIIGNPEDISVGGGVGSATSAKQDTGNTSLASIDTKTPTLGQALAVASTPVVLTAIQIAAITPSKNTGATDASTTRVIAASDSPEVTSIGGKTDTPATVADATSFSLISILKGILKILGFTSDTAVITDASGTIQQYLRGLVKLWIGGLAAGENVIGVTGGINPLVTAQMVRPSDNTPYGIGDLIGNSQTPASVVPITFSNAARITNGSGVVTGCRCVITAASGTIVLPKFDLLIFRPATNIPFAAAGYPADNAALNVSAAALKELVAVFSFTDTAWRNQAGGLTAAGDHVWQAVLLSSGRAFAPFSLAALSSANLVGLMQAQSIFNFGAVANTFDFVLDVDGN